MESTDGKLFSVFQIFSKYRFSIPDYQRGYSWDFEQRQDLLKDIEALLKPNTTGIKHFTGTIVATKSKDDRYEIIDGQQRLTSLFILLFEINKIKKLPENILIDQVLSDRRILQLNKETDEFFKKRIIRDDDGFVPKNKSQKNLMDAKIQFSNWINDNLKNLDLIVTTILKYLGFLLYIPESSKEAGLMFEVINNRGKPLSELEKIKNFLIYYCTKTGFDELGEEVNTYWCDILSNLSEAGKIKNEDEDAFLRYCWLVFYDPNKKKSYNVYKDLKENYSIEKDTGENRQELLEFVQVLYKFSSYLKELFTNHSKSIERLSYHPENASIMPLYFAICNKFDNNSNGKEKLLDILEKLNFRIYVCPDVIKRSDRHQGTLFSLAHNLFWNLFDFKSIEIEQSANLLEKILIRFIENWCPLEKFVESLTLDKREDFNYRSWNGVKYFLADYEVFINKKKTILLSEILNREETEDIKPDDRLTIEHIWATKNMDKEYSYDELLKDRIDLHEKKRLGNLALLEGGINSQGDKLHLSDKLKIYFDQTKRATNFQQIRELIEIHDSFKKELTITKKWKKYKYLDYYKKIIDKREDLLLSYAINRWGIQNEQKYKVQINSWLQKEDGKIFEFIPKITSN